MRRFATLLPIFTILSTAMLSCGKNTNNLSNNITKSTINKNLSQANSIKTSIPNGETTSVSLLQGFNKMGYTFTESCFENDNIYYPKNIEKSVVNLSDNMKEVDFRNVLNIGVSASVPVKGFEIAPELKYAREASVSRLSRSTTYSVYVRLGDAKITKEKDSKIRLKPSLNSLFDANGVLVDKYNFMKKCGDEIITQQRLSAKILITLKLNFDSQKILNSVEQKLGVAQNILSVGGKPGVNANVNYLNEEVKKGVHLTLYAVQNGGKPAELTKILNLKNKCELSNIKECQGVLEKLNQYVGEDFYNQLDASKPEKWSIESSHTVPYDELSVEDNAGRQLSFPWVSDYNDSIAYGKMKATVNQAIAKQVENYLIANSLLESKNLALDEKRNLEDISNKSQLNVETLQNFSKECHKNSSDCFDTSKFKLSSMILTYDDAFLKPNIGTIVAKIRSSSFPLMGQNHRSSEDFLDFRNIIDSGKFSSLYFRLKTIDNKIIEDTKIRFDIMCNKSWYKGFDPVIFNGLHAGYEVLIGTVQNNFDNNCGGNEMGYIANPSHVPYADFSVEVWGRE
ncbi:hypothetical protein [Silvanigrella aquatica]|uniref:MACPF domain-containing protein n=1 Tax=Silvanigrella aquatica TaxID=1915309 RepID=A0A1L4CYR9_9BACT|nr:hypothetical protein [Silvanigrella aquatica]APJ03099.1 hypothetical protein AXG55_03925 [Silvanigrella aquatica]